METHRDSEECTASVRKALNILGGKWSLLVLVQLYNHPQRFNQLRKKLVDISPKALTDTLRHLEQNRIISRRVFPTVPVTVEYSLTEKGRALRTVLSEMSRWELLWANQQEM